METSIDGYIRESFQIKKRPINTYSPLVLAYIGDGIYDLIIRTKVVEEGNTNVNMLHLITSSYVKASAQSEMIEVILPHLTEEEESYYKRGRNANSHTMAKNASMIDYRKATGFEALMGYLYLTDQLDRMMELIRIGLEHFTPKLTKKHVRRR